MSHKNSGSPHQQEVKRSGGAHSAAETPETRRVHLAGREYYSEKGKTFELRLVGKLKQQLSSDPTLRPEFPPSLGLSKFTQRATEATLGRSSRVLLENRALGVQTPGFTAAVRLGAELLRRWREDWRGPVYLSSPCDDSLAHILHAAGIQDIRRYFYWDAEQRGVCVEKLVGDLREAPQGSVVLLSASAHFPTGANLSQQQWAVVTQLLVRRRLFPFFLLPTQGLCSGALEEDAWPVQLCAAQGAELLCAQSFSHCFGLYGEAVGHLLCVLPRSELSSVGAAVGSLWARPSAGGAQVVAMVTGNPAHLVEWRREVRLMVERCMLVREILREKLRILGTPGCWDHLIQQRGLYCCTGLNDQQVEFLSKVRRLYLLPNGCLNVSAINGANVDFVAESIHLAVTASL